MIRNLLLLGLFLLLQKPSQAQEISYTVPQGFEKAISSADYKLIVDYAVPAIAKRYTIDNVKDGTVFLKKGQEMQALNLHNIIGKCVAVKDKGAWNKIVEGHFDNIFSSIDEQKKIDPASYASIKKYLSLRVYPEEIINQRGGTAGVVVRKDLEGTWTMLMLDLPGTFTPVMKEMFTAWKKDSAEVFRTAQEHINLQEVEKVTQTFDIDGSKIEISFVGNEDYAASYILDLMNNSPALVGEWGTVIAVPNKGIADMCKVSKDHPLDFVKFIQRMRPQVHKSFTQHEQPVSEKFFWYYKGTFKAITIIEQENGNINVISPYALSELMTGAK